MAYKELSKQSHHLTAYRKLKFEKRVTTHIELFALLAAMNEDENDIFKTHDSAVFTQEFINFASDYILNNVNDNNKMSHKTTA